MDNYKNRLGYELKRLYPNLYFAIKMYEGENDWYTKGIMLDVVVYEEKDVVEENEIEKTIIASELSSIFCYYKTMEKYEKEFSQIINFCQKTIDKDIKAEKENK